MALMPYLTGGHEPGLNEVMDDPIFELLMRRDGVNKEHINQLVKFISEAAEGLDAPFLQAVETA